MIDQLLFNKYKILRTLGQTDNSIVYLAKHNKLDNLWAVKVLIKAKSDEILLAEATILKTLKHDGIPQIVDIEEDEERIYIIEEFVEGTNLKEYKKKNQVSEELLIDWGIQLCDILTYLHTREPHPIIYRDMKPENIVLRPDGKLKLIDFGIAREHKPSISSDTTLMGTKGYAAPEQFGFAQSDGRTDIFALGVTLYFLITDKNLAHPPYVISNFIKNYKEYSIKLETIIVKAGDMLPGNRYQTAEEMKIALQLLLTKTVVKQRIQLNPNDKKIITIEGLTSRIGVTHFALMLSSFFQLKGKKVACVELTDRESFYHMETQLKGIYSKQTSFIYYNITFYPKCTLQRLEEIYLEGFDWIICDCGITDPKWDDIKWSSQIMFVLSGISPWEVDRASDFAKEHRHPFPYHLAINYTNKWLLDDFIQHIESQQQCKISAIPFQPNPFSLTKEEQQYISEIVGITEPKKKSRWKLKHE